MLKEIKQVRQDKGEPFRRWFCDEIFDLIVWYSIDRKIYGFQLCYPEGARKKALTWLQDKGYSHNLIDEGEDRPTSHKMTPILVSDGLFAKDQITPLFQSAAQKMEKRLVDFIIDKLKEYQGGNKEISQDCLPTIRKTVKRKK